MSGELKKIDWSKPIEWTDPNKGSGTPKFVGWHPSGKWAIVAWGDDGLVMTVDEYGRQIPAYRPDIRNVPEKKLQELTPEEFALSGVFYGRRKSDGRICSISLAFGGVKYFVDDVGYIEPSALRDYELAWPGRGWVPAGIEVTE